MPTPYSNTSLYLNDLEHESDHFYDYVFEIDCNATYQWKHKALNDIDVKIDSVKLLHENGYTDILPVLDKREVDALRKELIEVVSADFYIDQSE